MEKFMSDKIVNIENSQEKELELLKEKYLEVEMPQEQFDKLKLAMDKGKKDNRKERQKIVWSRTIRSAAAILLAFIILPNTTVNVAHAMEQIPVLGNLVKLVTWRDYQYEDERHQADVSVAKLDVTELEETIDTKETESEVSTNFDTMAEEESVIQNNLKKTTEGINAEIEEITSSLIDEFETHIQEEMGYQDIVIQSEVLADTEDYFTLKLLCYQGAGSGYQWNYYYTIDLNTGERLQLKDVFVEGADYISVISENIKKQMREQMAADENVYYWLEDEIEEWNFNSITDETLFYMNEKGSVVISFNEGDVAPMYMGVVEFEIEDSVIKDIRK